MELNSTSQAKLDRILETAKQEFNCHGYNKTTMNSIIASSNISRGTVYKHFKDKQEIYETLIKTIYNEEIRTLKEILIENRTFTYKMDKFIKLRLIKYTNTNDQFFQDHYTKSEMFSVFVNNYKDLIKKLRIELYHQGKTEGYIHKDISSETLECYFEVIQNGLQSKHQEISKLNKKTLSDLLKLIYAGMLTKPETNIAQQRIEL